MTPSRPASTPRRILLLGSGELGKEVTISLKRLGREVIAVDSYPDAPAMQVADSRAVIDMTDPDALRALVERVAPDLVVPEVEAIATRVLVEMEARTGLRVVPTANAVLATMDRQRIRALAAGLEGVRTSAFAFASSAQEIREALEITGLPAFVKPTMSSSGHGQSRITSIEEADAAWRAALEGARSTTGRVIVEEEVRFDSEITLLTVRSLDPASGEVVTSFAAPIGHRQVDGDYVESWQPAEISPAALAQCQEMARTVTTALTASGPGPGLGLFGVEFFITGDQAWFSELSPRPHDTGMTTMITQGQSEFDLHARAILGLPVDPAATTPGASAVITSTRALADPVYRGIDRALSYADELRIFGKPVSRAGRRLGVALAKAGTAAHARERARAGAEAVEVVEAGAMTEGGSR